MILKFCCSVSGSHCTTNCSHCVSCLWHKARLPISRSNFSGVFIYINFISFISSWLSCLSANHSIFCFLGIIYDQRIEFMDCRFWGVIQEELEQILVYRTISGAWLSSLNFRLLPAADFVSRPLMHKQNWLHYLRPKGLHGSVSCSGSSLWKTMVEEH